MGEAVSATLEASQVQREPRDGNDVGLDRALPANQMQMITLEFLSYNNRD